jgi:hypothetical protein
MADAKISQLPVASTPLAGTELVPVVQGGATEQTTVEAILTSTVPSGTANGVLYLNGSKVVTSGSALTFDGTNFATTGAIASGGSYNFNTTSGRDILWGTSSYTYITGNPATGVMAFGIANTEQMRLNSTGLGIGTDDPGAKLDIVGATSNQIRVGTATSEHYRIGRNASDGFLDFYGSQTGYQGYRFGGIDGTWATIDSSGNLGLGVTPSAWASTSRAIQLAASSSLEGRTNDGSYVALYSNATWNGTNFIYQNTATAAYYKQSSSVHSWHTALAGDAGDPISFTQAMTLDASGNLALGATSANARLDVVGGSIRVNEDSIGTKIITVRSDYAGLGPAINVTTSHPLLFLTGNTERMRLDSSGNLGLGVTPSASWTGGANLQIGLGAVYANSSLGACDVSYNSVRTASNSYVYAQTGLNATRLQQRDGAFNFFTAASGTAGDPISFTQAMTLDASGNLLVGQTSGGARLNITAAASQNGLNITLPTVDYFGAVIHNQATSGDNSFIAFGTESSFTFRGNITYNRAGGLTAYNTTSDYRAKDIIGPVTDSGALIDSTPVYMGKMKDATQERPMFIAHEVPAYAHTGEKDAVDADGNPVYQQMDASALIPVMWAEIQSLRARVAALEA